MRNFARREFELLERMDAPCTFAEWSAAARGLAQINRWTRAYTPVIALVSRVLARRGVGYEPLHVVDLGCGSGDMLRALYAWAAKRSVALRLTGIDANPYAARAAREADRREGVAAGTIAWVTGDLFAADLSDGADVVVSSLVAHHLPDDDIVRLLQLCDAKARAAWMLLDLVRSERAHDVFAVLSRALRMNALLQADGPVSFRRALSVAEWNAVVDRAGVGGVVASLALSRVAVSRVK